jgi:hypothetical protein
MVGKNGQPYAFAGHTIKLNQADFDAWEATYSAIPNLRVELQAFDDWFRGKPEKQRDWFHITSRNLARKHQECLDAEMERGLKGVAVKIDHDEIVRQQIARDRAEELANRLRREDGLRYLAEQEAKKAAAEVQH